LCGLLIGFAYPACVLASQSEIETITQQFINCNSTGDYNTAVKRFDKTMNAALPKSKLKAVWGGIVAVAGPFRSCGSSRVATQGGI